MDSKVKKNVVKPRNITIYGLISFYGTERAKKCATYLYKTLPKLYGKPNINLYYDYEWAEVVKQLQEQYSSKYRRLKYLKHPVIIFFNDKYIGDHRAIIHYVIVEHRVLPDLPFPNLFPDFTDLLPKDELKKYVYFDLRVGDWDDYVVGKMVFELHADLVPETCNFFMDLCKVSHERAYGTNEPKWKFSYIGSTIHRIYGSSFIQGGKISGCPLRVKDENFKIKHCNRGILSLCNQGGNNSTTEFCISLKENKWLDGEVIAFGQLIFGEPILAAIEEVPTYYERPLKDIIIVNCGVIPNYSERLDIGFISEIEKQKELINKDVEKLRKQRIEDIDNFARKIKSFLERSEEEKSVEFIYLEDPSDLRFDFLKPPVPNETLSEYLEEDLFEEYSLEEEFQPEEQTLELIMKKRRAKNTVKLTNMMAVFLDYIVENIDYAESDEIPEPLDYVPRKEIQDVEDVREVPSGELLEERFRSGLYSVPETIRKLLVDTFNQLTPSQLKMIGQDVRDLLGKAGIEESTIKITGSESIMSGVFMALLDLSQFSGGLGLHDALVEIYKDSILLLQEMGPDTAKEKLISKLMATITEPKSEDTSET